MNDVKKLHLGCGERYLSSFIHVDINKLDHVDIVTSVDNLDMFEDDSIDEIYSSHVLEYFDKFESLEVNEAAPRMKKSKEEMDIEKTMAIVSGLKKGGIGSRYGKEFDRAKNKALAAINDMLTYAKIGS